jgi:hypothetical protein
VIEIGFACILWIYEDAVRNAENNPELWERLKPLIGQVVLELAVHNSHFKGKTGHAVRGIRGHVNAIQRLGTLRSTDSEILVWARNCLRPLRELDDSEWEIVERLISEERERRTKGKASHILK